MLMIIGAKPGPGNKVLLTFRPGPSGGELHELTVDRNAFEDYMDGEKSLQEAFPELTDAERELFLTVIDGECYWKCAYWGRNSDGRYPGN